MVVQKKIYCHYFVYVIHHMYLDVHATLHECYYNAAFV